MKKFLFFLITVSLPIYGETAPQEESIEVSPGGKLIISLSSSDITINTWGRNEIQIRSSEEDGKLSITKNATTVTIKSRQSFDTDLSLNIPENFNIEVHVSAGDFKLNGNLKGSIDVTNSGGDILFNNVSGKVSIKTGGGNIKGNSINSSAVIKSYGGDITLSDVKGRCLIETGGGNIKVNSVQNVEKISTSGGNIIIRNASGNGNIFTGGGNIDVNMSDGNLTYLSYGGDIRINEAGGRINVKSGGGTIRIKELKGSVTAKNESGDILINLTTQSNNSEIKTMHGNIRIGVPENFKATLIAKSKDPDWWKDEKSAGETIKSDFRESSLRRNKSRQQIEASYELNGGGTRILLETNYGDISIKKNER
jgi:hypothetical protein